jgi:hypothetical protein
MEFIKKIVKFYAGRMKSDGRSNLARGPGVPMPENKSFFFFFKDIGLRPVSDFNRMHTTVSGSF